MSNSIDGVRGSGSNNSAQIHDRQKTAEHTSDTDRSHRPASSDDSAQVVLTESAQKLQEVERNLADQPVVDTKKVDATRASIADGSYKVDAKQVADKLIESEKTLP